MSWLSEFVNTATAESGTLQWVLFMLNKYSSMFINGTLTTLFVAISGTFGGYLLGLAAGLSQYAAPNEKRSIFARVRVIIVTVYIELFRGTPMIVQGMIIYYGLRQSGVQIAPASAGILVMLLNTGAYMAETVRSGINAIPIGQREGALSIGLTPARAMTFVILPQAVKNIIPEMCNIFLTNLKMTSVLNVIGVSELFYMAKTAGGVYYKYFEAYLAIALIYLVLCFIFSRLTVLIEKKSKGRQDYVLATEYINM